MGRQVDVVTGEAVEGQRPGPSAAVRRQLRLGPRTRLARRPSRPRGASETAGETVLEKERALAEWHDMTPGQQQAAWAELRAWVAWLHDRYELGTEERLPRCWARHPGLVEELRSLRAWRLEIYSGRQPSGQAARYWHAELRQIVHAAVPMYAAGCRTGHKGASTVVEGNPELAEEWAHADPLAGTPGIDIAAGQARLAGECLTTEAVATALDSGEASAVPLLRDYVFYAGAWWVPASAGWVKVPRPGGAGESFPPGPRIPETASPTLGTSGDPWQGWGGDHVEDLARDASRSGCHIRHRE
jgi:hypothetical protein